MIYKSVALKFVYSLVFIVSLFCVLLAYSQTVRLFVQDILWDASKDIKALLREEFGENYTIVSSGSKNNTMLGAIIFWVDFSGDTDFVAVSANDSTNKAIYFSSIDGNLGSAQRNILSDKNNRIVRVCDFDFDMVLVEVENDWDFILIGSGSYAVDVNELVSFSDELNDRCI
ncbi:hypothetical protein [Ferrimonas balearica]|uniref:hypothetical protein n=1 Tax=Ferrimonas balearica TaxID=44012 RepID=UPI001F3F1F33|nr:hypothetical protein [Ferrimonas balearica]MBY6096711.1 hypothetical protein [Ferrimonas balearica]